MKPLIYVVGAGGFGRETLDVLEALGVDTRRPDRVRVLDDSPREVDLDRLRDRGVSYAGTVASQALHTPRHAEYIIAIGDPALRRTIASRLDPIASPAPPFVHPSATIGTRSALRPGTVICAGARLSTNVIAGLHAHVNAGAIIGHDTRLGDCVSINPGAIVSGNVTVHDGTLVGAGATILQGLTVGTNATIGAAACVTRNVLPQHTVKGVPAR